MPCSTPRWQGSVILNGILVLFCVNTNKNNEREREEEEKHPSTYPRFSEIQQDQIDRSSRLLALGRMSGMKSKHRAQDQWKWRWSLTIFRHGSLSKGNDKSPERKSNGLKRITCRSSWWWWWSPSPSPPAIGNSNDPVNVRSVWAKQNYQ